MRFQHVALEAFSYILPEEVVTSEAIETALNPIYTKLGLPQGRLELMTGIRERRFFPPGTRPGEISAQTINQLLNQTGFDRKWIGALMHGSVSRDQLEPATACRIHHETGLPGSAMVLDVSNACLGILNGILLIANMIELGQIHAGIAVGTEVGRNLVEGTIDSLITTKNITRADVKSAFASLTIGSGSAAVLVCDRKLSRTGNRLLGGTVQADTTHHQLCAGGAEAETHGDDRPRMLTDSEALLHAGVGLAKTTWQQTKSHLGWENASVDKAFTHQVGRVHRKLLYDELELGLDLDFATVEYLGNTGAAALPLTSAIGIEQGHVSTGDRIAFLGIGSGLNCVMLGTHWQS